MVRRKRIKSTNTVLVSDPHIQSLAASVLLKNKLLAKTRTGRPKWRIWLSFRNRFLKKMARQGPLICYYCGKNPLYKNTRRTPYEYRATIDHIHPRSRGGKEYDEENLVVCCSFCNNRKADRLLEDFTW